MNTTDYENIWKASLIHVTDEFSLPPVVLQAGEAIIGTLGNFSVSTGKAKAKKTFNVSAIVAAALVNGQVLEYKASFPESKRNTLYFDTEQNLESAYFHPTWIRKSARRHGLSTNSSYRFERGINPNGTNK